MPRLKPDNVLEVAFERDEHLDETSDESFDRTAFAMQALELLRPVRTTVAVCEGRRLRVETGRAWGRGPAERWAMLAVPPTASRRAITTAVAALARAPRPYALALLEARAGGFEAFDPAAE
jgi:hypothetical protein